MSRPLCLDDVWKYSTPSVKALIVLSPIIVPIVAPLAISWVVVLIALEELGYWKRRRTRKRHEQTANK